MQNLLIQIHCVDNESKGVQHERAMTKRHSDPVHCWLVWRKAHEAVIDFLYRGLEETGISDTDFRFLEALLHKGPLPVNTIGPKVHLTPGSISVAVDRLLEKRVGQAGGKPWRSQGANRRAYKGR